MSRSAGWDGEYWIPGVAGVIDKLYCTGMDTESPDSTGNADTGKLMFIIKLITIDL